MKPLIVANWKMNPETAGEAESLFDSVRKGLKNVRKAEIGVTPGIIRLLCTINNSEAAILIDWMIPFSSRLTKAKGARSNNKKYFRRSDSTSAWELCNSSFCTTNSAW